MSSTKLMKQQIIPLFFSPKGRISRGLFWKSNLVLFLGYLTLFIFLILAEQILGLSSEQLGIGGVIIIFFYWYIVFVLTVKRLHDINWSGWLALPIMMTGIIWIFIGLINGKITPNRHGENPIEYEKRRLYINKDKGLPPPPPPLDNPISKIILSLMIILPVPSLVVAGLVTPKFIKTEISSQEESLPFILQDGDKYQKVEATDNVDAYYIVTRANGNIEHYTLDGTLKWSNVQSEENRSTVKINFVKQLYAQEIKGSSVDVVEQYSSSELIELISKRDAIAKRYPGEMCEWVARVLIPGNGDVLASINDIKFSVLNNGLVRASFIDNGENILRDFDIQCDGRKCKISDIYTPNSYKQELQEIIDQDICVSSESEVFEEQTSTDVSSQNIVNCKINFKEIPMLVEGKCNFTPVGNGSFFLQNADTYEPILDDLKSIHVDVMGGKGEVLVKGQSNEFFMGEVIQSKEQKACWENSKISICAWK